MNPESSSQEPIRLNIPRHLQDYNGYCGPACALMLVDFAGSAKSPPVYAQEEYFKEIRQHARESRDRRPIKSPAESLLEMVNTHTAGDWEWSKIDNAEPRPVAKRVFSAIIERQQPCLILVSKGMHWVVAFGVIRNDHDEPSGLLMRDPAWTGMPKFYGLSVFPEKPRICHGPSPCACMKADGENSPGTIHERFFTTTELLTHRGLQGAPDHEGDGAIALVPSQNGAAAFDLPAASGPAPLVANAQARAGEAALSEVRKNGLCGSPHSPPEWDKALKNATAGEPILVKDPEDSRDDFYLVPLTPKDPASTQGAWAMLDANTLKLREVSLLENWTPPAFPNPNKDPKQISKSPITLADGTVVKLKPTDITPNSANLVWKPSAASILPYWPVKEFTILHPKTGIPEKIYLTQENNFHPSLGPDEPTTPEAHQPPSQPQKSPTRFVKLTVVVAALAGAILIAKEFQKDPQRKPSSKSPNGTEFKDSSTFQDPSPEPGTSSETSRIEILRDEIEAFRKRGFGERHPEVIKRVNELASLTDNVHSPPAALDYDALQTERERLSAILHHQEEGMDVRKYDARLKEIEALLKKFPRPKK